MASLWPGSFDPQGIDHGDRGPISLHYAGENDLKFVSSSLNSKNVSLKASKHYLIHPGTVPADAANAAIPFDFKTKRPSEYDMGFDNASYLHSKLPDLGLPNDILLNLIKSDDAYSSKQESYAHYGNRIASIHITPQTTVIAFAGSENSSGLYIAWTWKGISRIIDFYTYPKPFLNFSSPILQIETAPASVRQMRFSIGVRTYTEFSWHEFNLDNPMAQISESTPSSNRLRVPLVRKGEPIKYTHSNFHPRHKTQSDDNPGRPLSLIDFDFDPYRNNSVLAIDRHKQLFEFHRGRNTWIRYGSRISYSSSSEVQQNESLLKVGHGHDSNTALLLWDTRLEMCDTRSSEPASILFDNKLLSQLKKGSAFQTNPPSNSRNRDLCKSRHHFRHLTSGNSFYDIPGSPYHSFLTDQKIYWVDRRYPNHALLGVEHHRNTNDSTLSSILLYNDDGTANSDSVQREQTVLVWSSRNPVITAATAKLNTMDDPKLFEHVPSQIDSAPFTFEPFGPIKNRIGLAASSNVPKEGKAYFDLYEAEPSGRVYHRLLSPRDDHYIERHAAIAMNEKTLLWDRDLFKLDRKNSLIPHTSDEEQREQQPAPIKQSNSKYVLAQQAPTYPNLNSLYKLSWYPLENNVSFSQVPRDINIESKLENLLDDLPEQFSRFITLAELSNVIQHGEFNLDAFLSRNKHDTHERYDQPMIDIFNTPHDIYFDYWKCVDSRSSHPWPRGTPLSLDSIASTADDLAKTYLLDGDNNSLYMDGHAQDNDEDGVLSDTGSDYNVRDESQVKFLHASSLPLSTITSYNSTVQKSCNIIAKDLAMSKLVIRNIQERPEYSEWAVLRPNEVSLMPAEEEEDAHNDGDGDGQEKQKQQPLKLREITKDILSDWDTVTESEKIHTVRPVPLNGDVGYDSTTEASSDAETVRSFNTATDYVTDNEFAEPPPVEPPPIELSQPPQLSMGLSQTPSSPITQSQVVRGPHANRKRKKRRVGF